MIRPTLFMVLLLLLAACLDRGGAAPITTQQTSELQDDVSEGLTEIPDNPLDEIPMLTLGLEDIEMQAVDDYLDRLPGYVEGSAQIEAIHPGPDGPNALVTYEADVRTLGRMSCVVVAPLAASTTTPPTSGGCSPVRDVSSNELVGLAYRLETGQPHIFVRHSPDAEAVAVELASGDHLLIRPNGSTVSFHRWVGELPVGVTVFWADGSTTHEELSG